MKRPVFVSVIFLLAIAFIVPRISFAQSATDLQVQINALLAEVQQLQSQLAAQGSSPTAAFCYTFTSNLSIGQSGAAVTALQTALQKDGENVSVTGTFDDQTASAVTGFQEKYASQILTPNGLQYGTGYVGAATRGELNTIFGCGTSTTTPVTSPIPVPSSAPTITVTAPAGTANGQTITAGSTYNVQWTSTGVNAVNLELCNISGYCQMLNGLSGNVGAAQDSFNWYVDPSNLQFPGTNFRIEVIDAANAYVSAYSGYFGVTGATSVAPSNANATPTSTSINSTAAPNYSIPTVSISASPTTIIAGQTTNLTWSSMGATSCTVSGTDGYNDNGPWSKISLLADGSLPTIPYPFSQAAYVAQYQATCTGPGGTGNASVQVNIMPMTSTATTLPSQTQTSAPSISVTGGNSPAAGALIMGATGNPLAAFNFTETSNLENVKVNQLDVVDILSPLAAGGSTAGVLPSFSNLTLWNGGVQIGGVAGKYLGATTVNGANAFIYQFTFGNNISFIISRNNTLPITLRGTVNALTQGGVTDGSVHTFAIATSALVPTATSAVMAVGQTSNQIANVAITGATGNPQTVLHNAMTFSAFQIGPVSTRIPSLTDQLATLTFTPNTGGSVALNTVQITFTGSTMPSSASAMNAFASGVYLVSGQNGNFGMQFAPTNSACNNSTETCVVTFSWPAGANGFQVSTNPATFTLVANTLSNLNFSGSNNNVNLFASITGASAIQYTDGINASVAAVNGLSPLTLVPVQLFGAQYVATPATNPYDVNGDGVVNMLDYQMVSNAALGVNTTCGFKCDLNGDGQVNVIDLQKMSNYLQGIGINTTESTSPSTLAFTVSAGSINSPSPSSVSLGINNYLSNGGITVSPSGANWLSLGAMNSSGMMSVSVQPGNAAGGLSAGTYMTSITISAYGQTVTVPVTLTVTPLQPSVSLSITPSPLIFSAEQGSASPASQIFTTNVANGLSAWISSVSSNQGWLSTNLTGGSYSVYNGSNFYASINSSGLSAGTYNGTITISGNFTGLSVGIPVTLTITPALSSAASLYDVNGDGVVNALDYQTELNAALGVNTTCGLKCDLNGDGQVNVVDLQKMSNYLQSIGVNPNASTT